MPADHKKATVGQLKEGESYQFRVKAINKAGASHPSDPSRTVIAKARHCKFIIKQKLSRIMFYDKLKKEICKFVP